MDGNGSDTVTLVQKSQNRPDKKLGEGLGLGFNKSFNLVVIERE